MLLALILGLMLEPPAAENQGSGLKLLQECEKYLATDDWAPKDHVEVMSCIQYIAGFMDAVEMHSAAVTGGVSPICRPEHSTNHQMVLVVVKGLKERPQLLHNPRGILVMAILAGAFPCPQKAAPSK